MAEPNYTTFKQGPDSLSQIIGSATSRSGQQKAHIVGRAYSEVFTNGWFARLLGPNGVNSGANIVLLPETQLGGATAGTATHRFQQAPEFDKRFYDPGGSTSSQKYLNVVERNLIARFAARTAEIQATNPSADAVTLRDIGTGNPKIADIELEYRVKVRNFLDFAKILQR